MTALGRSRRSPCFVPKGGKRTLDFSCRQRLQFVNRPPGSSMVQRKTVKFLVDGTDLPKHLECIVPGVKFANFNNDKFIEPASRHPEDLILRFLW